MSFFRLVLLVTLSLGIGVHNSYAEVIAESETPEAKEILEVNYVTNRGFKSKKSFSEAVVKNFSYPLFKEPKNSFHSEPSLLIKRHLWVMQFLL